MHPHVAGKQASSGVRGGLRTVLTTSPLNRGKLKRKAANTGLRERIAEAYERNRNAYESPCIRNALEQEGVPFGEKHKAYELHCGVKHAWIRPCSEDEIWVVHIYYTVVYYFRNSHYCLRVE